MVAMSTVPARPFTERTGTALLAGCMLGLVLTLPEALRVVRTGIFLNPDDAMRAVEVRDFLSGQGWFDLVPHRLSPDHPFVMHWSRLIDLPLAVLSRLFGLALPAAGAELAMRLTAPSLLLVAALATMLRLVRTLIGPRAMLPASLMMAGSTEIISNFIPGHIHHHAAQATLLLLAVMLALDALKDRAAWRPAAGAGVAAAVSLGIGVQNLPFLAGLTAVLGLWWVWRGAQGAAALAGFGGGLGSAALVVFGLDVPPSAYGSGACDAFSTAHLLAATVGGAACLALAAGSWRLPTVGLRVIAAGVAAVATLVPLAILYPACLHDPIAGVDPLLRDQWLADVGEALPLVRLIALDWASGLPLAMTLAGGLAATVAALLAAPPSRRPAWAALLLLASIGTAGTLYQVRVAPSACAILVPGLAAVVLRVFAIAARVPRRPALLLAAIVGLCGNGAAWTALAAPAGRLLAAGAQPSAVSRPAVDPAACFEPAAYDILKGLAPGLVLSTIDPGSAILAATSQSVLAAPYHRNVFGNRAALLAFPATPTAAEPIVRAARASYVVLCRSSNEVADIVARHPDSLAAALLDGRPPDWLRPVGDGGEPILVFRVGP